MTVHEYWYKGARIMSKVAIATDSTMYLPKEITSKYDIRVAPATVIFAEEEFKDGVDITPSEFYERLQDAKELPTTSQPSPAEVKEIFDDILYAGCDVLGIFVSSKLSGTISSANQALAMLPEAKIEIIDSLTTSMGGGWPIIMAAKAAQAGKSLAECKQIAEQALEKSGILFTVDTLEFLHKGGRIGGATRFLGTALQFKPVLELIEGRIEPIERVRTRVKALNRIMELAADRIGDKSPIYIGILHANDLETAKKLQKMTNDAFNPAESIITDVSPGVGVHVGPGTVGIAYLAGYK